MINVFFREFLNAENGCGGKSSESNATISSAPWSCCDVESHLIMKSQRDVLIFKGIKCKGINRLHFFHTT